MAVGRCRIAVIDRLTNSPTDSCINLSELTSFAFDAPPDSFAAAAAMVLSTSAAV